MQASLPWRDSQNLIHELAEFGVKVILIEPGGVKTNFVDNIKTAKNYNPNDSPVCEVDAENI